MSSWSSNQSSPAGGGSLSQFGTPASASDVGASPQPLFKVPAAPTPRRITVRQAKVLDEDQYVQKVEEIIERDFFPELEKMKAQKEYLEAIENKDVPTMRRLEERYSSGGSGLAAAILRSQSSRLQSPSTWETPEEPTREKDERERDGNSQQRDQEAGQETPSASASSSSASASSSSKLKMGLDEFMAKHTSEDNASFNEIQAEQNEKFRITHAWMFKDDEVKSLEMKSESLNLPSIEHQALNESAEKSQSVPVEGWTYKNVNAVFYPPEGVEFTKAEEVERISKQRSINFDNTRFKKNPWKNEIQKTNLEQTAYTKKEKEAGHVGVDGQVRARPETPSVNGFSLLKMTPSPMVHPSESPLMTWGEIESTPYRLEGCDTPLPMHSAGGPTFKIQELPKRDRIGHELAEKNSKFYRDRKGKAILKARSNIRTPKGSLTDRVSGMSPAAQRLATNKLGIRLGTDKALRASYTPSPMRKGTPSSSKRSARDLISSSVRAKMTPKTPVITTPSTRMTPSRTTLAAESMDPDTMTDDLLNLPSTSKSASSSGSGGSSSGSRPRAADFL